MCVFVKSKLGASRVLSSISCYVEKELKLEVNRTKSVATRPWKIKILGYSFYHKKGAKALRIAKGSMAKYKFKVRSITSRSKPYAIYKRYKLLGWLDRGWTSYFKVNVS